MGKDNVTRRGFMKTAAAGAVVAGTASQVFGTAHPQVFGANDGIRIGVVGPGGRVAGYDDDKLEGHMRHLCGSSQAGKQLRAKFDIAITAVCDVWDYRTDRAAELSKKE